MRAAAIVEIEIAGQCLPILGNGIVAVQVNLLILDRLPEVLDKDVIAPAPLAIHAALNAMLLKQADEGRAGELAAQVGVHDFWSAVFHDGFFQGVDAGIGRQAVRQAPAQHPTGGPVEYHAQIDTTPAHWDACRIHGPDLIRAFDGEVKQQVGIDAVRLVAPAGIGFAVDGLDVEFLHQRADMLSANFMAFEFEHIAQHPRPGKGMFQVQFINTTHEPQIGLGCGLRLVIDQGAGELEQLDLPDDRQIVGLVDHRFALASPMRQRAPLKNRSPTPAGRSLYACFSGSASPPASRPLWRTRLKRSPTVASSTA